MTLKDDGVNSYIQSIIFTNTTNKQWNNGSAKKWMFKRNLNPIKKVHKEIVNGNMTYRYRINPPEVFKKFITKPLNNGITFVIGFINE